MIRRLCSVTILILVPLVSLQSQPETAPKVSTNSPEASEAAKLAVEVAALYQRGKFKEALPLAKRCLEIRQRLFSPADDALRTALNNLAEVNMALRKYKNAAPLLERLIKSYEEFAPSDSRLVTALQKMALVKFVAGERGKAEKLYRRALEITENEYGLDDPRVASAAFHLAEYYQDIGDLDKAEPLYRRIFAIRERQSPTGDSEEFRQARDRYACLLHKTGRKEQARQLEARPQSPGPHSTPVAGSVIQGKAISIPKPPYPDEAREARAAGTVVVQVVIDERGRVIRACAIQGPSLLMKVSERTACRAVFTPTKLSGQPVRVAGVITYNFVAH